MSHWCHICKVKLLSLNDWMEHEKGKKHRGKMIQHKRNNSNASVISVSGITPSVTIEEMINHFQHYGKIVGVLHRDKDNIIIRYANCYSANNALKSSHELHGQCLKVWNSKTIVQVEQNIEDPVKQFMKMVKDIHEALIEKENLYEKQIEILISKLKLTEKEEAKRMTILESIEEWLAVQLPGSKLQQFGSAIAGLAFHGADLDVYLHLPKNVLEEVVANSTYKPKKEEEKNDSVVKILQKTAAVLRYHPDLKDLCFIHSARIPVVKFTHKPTGLTCDISCKNEVAMHNSRLIRQLQCFDQRIKPYLYILKYWAKVQSVTGFSKGAKLSNYALTLMAIFHLQQLNQPLVPSVEDLQSQVLPEERIFCNNWNVSFSTTIPQDAASENQSSVLELVRDFFLFYSQLHSEDIVLCPLIGKSLSKESFIPGEGNLPDCMKQYFTSIDQGETPLKINGPLCVQDPFELNFNVTHYYIGKYWKEFQEKCALAAGICSGILAGKSTSGMAELFHCSERESTEHSSRPCPNDNKLIIRFIASGDLNTESQAMYLRQVGHFMEELFSFSYLILEKVDEIVSRKRQKMEDQFWLQSHGDYVEHFLFKVPFNLWRGRANAAKTLSENSSMSLLDKERAITLRLAIQEGIHSLQERQPLVLCQTEMRFRINPCELHLIMENRETPEETFHEFVAGLRKHLLYVLCCFVSDKGFPFHLRI